MRVLLHLLTYKSRLFISWLVLPPCLLASQLNDSISCPRQTSLHFSLNPPPEPHSRDDLLILVSFNHFPVCIFFPVSL